MLSLTNGSKYPEDNFYPLGGAPFPPNPQLSQLTHLDPEAPENKDLQSAYLCNVNAAAKPHSTTRKIVEMLQTKMKLNYPFLPWDSKFQLPGSNRISIQPNDMSNPVMWGVTPDGRLYVAIKTQRVMSGSEKATITEKPSVETFYMLDDGNLESWVSDVNDGSTERREDMIKDNEDQLVYRHLGNQERILQRIKAVIQGESVFAGRAVSSLIQLAKEREVRHVRFQQ